MNIDEQEDLVRQSLCGGAIIEVRNAEEAKQAQSLGAVGVLWSASETAQNADELRNLLDAISILPICRQENRSFFEKVHREQYPECGPSWFTLIFGQPESLDDAKLLCCVASPDQLSEDCGKPTFVVCNDPMAARAAQIAGADGIVLRFLPTQQEMDELLRTPTNNLSIVAREPDEKVIGVLGLQGDYLLQQAGLQEAIKKAGNHACSPIKVQLVRSTAELELVDALVLPGGWSNLQSRMLRNNGLDTAILALKARQTPMLTICAGMILARSQDGKGCEDRLSLGLIDMTIDNNAVNGWREVRWTSGNPSRMRFANGPIVVAHGPKAHPLAWLDSNTIVGIQEGPIMGFAFHDGMHDLFVQHCLKSWAEDK